MHLTFYSRKDRQLEDIELKPTSEGWELVHECYRGPVDPTGSPHLSRCLEENYTPCPSAFADAFSEVWDALQDGTLTEPDAQVSLNRLSQWLQGYAKDPAFKLADLHKVDRQHNHPI
jgi:hypothetical protein